jgi:hypothetical protein
MSDGVLALSAAVEPWLRLAVPAVLVALAADRLFGRDVGQRVTRLDGPIDAHTERRLLAVVVAVGLGLRTVGWDDGITPPFWFTQASTLWIDRMLTRGTVWSSWIADFKQTWVGAAPESIFQLPVMAGLQAALGARFGLPVLGGAVFGTLAVVLAWALGRRVRSPAFGLCFAAFVAVSPLQLTWSRIGSYYIGAVPHVLLALLVGWIAGRRGSILLAALAGLVAWGSMYHYFAGRVGIPLAFVGVVAGSQRAWRLPRGIVLVLVAALAFGAVAYELHGETIRRALWPAYGTYPGSKGERDLADFVRQNMESIRLESWFAAERYFTTRRSGSAGSVWVPGLQDGGLVLLPVALLGLVGVVDVLRRIRRQWIWLVFAAAGVALPAFSVMTARRTVVFDVAWCAFAAHGLVEVVDWLGARFARRTRAWAAGVAVALIGAWSAAGVFALSTTLPSDVQPIPFGEAGFYDGLTCKRCLEAAREWSEDIADDAYVVLFNNDMERENRTSPAGLTMYGKIASLVAGRRDRFVEAYSLMADWDLEPPIRGAIFEKGTHDFASYLTEQIERARPARVVWHFERPTTWERWLAVRLAQAGGEIAWFPTPLAEAHGRGIRITTPADRLDDALAIMRGLATGARSADTACVKLVDQPTPPGGFAPIFTLTAGGDGLDRAPDWMVTSWREHRFKAFTFKTWTAPIGGWVGETSPGVLKAELVGQSGERVTYELPSLKREEVGGLPPRAATFRLNCAARVDGHWWIVEPTTGRVVSTHPAGASLPAGKWIGVTPGPSGELVLVDAKQFVLIFDPIRKATVVRFPARVVPGVRDTSDECAPVAAGVDWIATANLRLGVGSFYDRRGRDLGTVQLQRRLGVAWTMSALGGAGHFLAAAAGGTLRTWRVTLDPACVAGGVPAATANASAGTPP